MIVGSLFMCMTSSLITFLWLLAQNVIPAIAGEYEAIHLLYDGDRTFDKFKKEF